MIEENEIKSHSNKIAVVVVFLFTLLLVYILSIGPVALCCEKLHGDTQAIRQFYLPVIWLHENTILEKPLEMYVELWGIH